MDFASNTVVGSQANLNNEEKSKKKNKKSEGLDTWQAS